MTGIGIGALYLALALFALAGIAHLIRRHLHVSRTLRRIG